MPAAALSREQAQQFYDGIGRLHDWAELFEGRAKSRALEVMALRPGLRVLNAGVGTGKDHAKIVNALGGAEAAVAFDISPVMLQLVRHRTSAPAVRGDIRRLPFADHSFDRVLCAYVLDLIPDADLAVVLAELTRVLRGDGIAVLITLTDGVSPLSRLVVGGWKLIYRLSPRLVGGCRPLRPSVWLSVAGFELVGDEVAEQFGVPSEIVTAAPSSKTG